MRRKNHETLKGFVFVYNTSLCLCMYNIQGGIRFLPTKVGLNSQKQKKGVYLGDFRNVHTHIHTYTQRGGELKRWNIVLCGDRKNIYCHSIMFRI